MDGWQADLVFGLLLIGLAVGKRSPKKLGGGVVRDSEVEEERSVNFEVPEIGGRENAIYLNVVHSRSRTSFSLQTYFVPLRREL